MAYLAIIISIFGTWIVIALNGIASELEKSNNLKEQELNKNNNPN